MSTTQSRSPAGEPVAETKGHTIRWARRYDTVVKLMLMGKDRSLRQMTVDLAQIRPGDSVLDVGCGTGDLTMAAGAMAGSSGKVYGIDAASEMIDVARSKAAKAANAVEFRVDLIEALSFPDDHFDVVLSSLMMHHLPDDLKRKGLAEVYRVLKPGGHVVIVDMKRPVSLHDRLMTRLLLHGKMDTGAQDLPALVKAAGFTQIETRDAWFALLGFVRASK